MNEQQQPQQKNNSGCLIWIILAVLFYIFVLAPSKSSSSPKVTPTPAPTPTPRPTIALPTPSPTPRLYNGWELFSERGSANDLDGTTVVLSIFVSDEGNSWTWDVNNGRDNILAYDSLKSLGIACNWISKEAKRYGANAVFYYDWSVYNDLFYEVQLEGYVSSQYAAGVYSTVAGWIHRSIDSADLLRRYGADNIVYLLFINQPTDSMAVSDSFNQSNGKQLFAYEFCRLYIYNAGNEISPAGIAHEMLHCFGAKDLYYANYGITQEYVDYLERLGTNDIMRITWELNTGRHLYDSISNELSQIDAYYLGMIDMCSDVLTWGLPKNERQS